MVSSQSITVCILITLAVWESFFPFLPLFASPVDRARHFAASAFWTVANSVITRLLFVQAFRWAGSFRVGVLDRVFPEKRQGLLRMVVAVLLLDLWTTVWHRMNHTFGGLWQFHSLHHADEQMDFSTAMRFHVGEIFLSNVLRIPLMIVFGVRMEEVAVFELFLVSTVLVHHANIDIGPLEQPLRYIFATPGLHKVHHSILPEEHNSNYGSFLSVWDQMLGTFVTRENLHSIRFGTS